MHHPTTWHVVVHIDHPDGRNTEAEAILRTDAGVEIRHSGAAKRRRHDPDVPDIGDALAASRALSGLAKELLASGMVDEEWPTHPEVGLSLAADTEWAGLD